MSDFHDLFIKKRGAALESQLNNAEYYLAEAEMLYDRTDDEDAYHAIKSWSREVNKIKTKLEELYEQR